MNGPGPGTGHQDLTQCQSRTPKGHDLIDSSNFDEGFPVLSFSRRLFWGVQVPRHNTRFDCVSGPLAMGGNRSEPQPSRAQGVCPAEHAAMEGPIVLGIWYT